MKTPYQPHDLDVMTRTIFGEAGGESDEGKRAVAHVIVNRLRSGKWFGAKSIAGVCQKRLQFSCWNPGDPVHAKMLKAGPAQLAACRAAALAVLEGESEDPTGSATHYHADYINPPAWAVDKEPTVKIGRHLFFANIA